MLSETAVTPQQGCPKSPVFPELLRHPCFLTLFFRFLFVMLARLIAYGAGCLACRLAGRLALSTAAFLHGVLQNLCIQCLNMLHDNFPPVSYPGWRLTVRSRL